MTLIAAIKLQPFIALVSKLETAIFEAPSSEDQNDLLKRIPKRIIFCQLGCVSFGFQQKIKCIEI